MDIQIANIPTELKNHSQWICWDVGVRDDKETKLPKDPNGGFAQTDDPSTWAGFTPMMKAANNHDGIGFVFTEEDDFVGIDLDKCRNAETGEWEDWALDVMSTMGGFIEISPSGTGAHIILKGEIPGERRRKGNIEIYEDGRYFTVTGNAVSPDGTAIDSDRDVSINSNQEGLNEVYTEYLLDGEEEESDDGKGEEQAIQITPPSGDRPNLADLGYDRDVEIPFSPEPNQDVLTEYEHNLLIQAKTADNGYGFALLWRGDWEGFFKFSDKHTSTGYSQSEADMIFCNQLSFWCSGDPVLIDRFVRASGLMREKWNEPHYSDGTTYGERTIEKAIARVEDTYDDDRYEEVQSRSSESDEEQQDSTEDDSVEGNAQSNTQKKAAEDQQAANRVVEDNANRSRDKQRNGINQFRASSSKKAEKDASSSEGDSTDRSKETRPDPHSRSSRNSRNGRSARTRGSRHSSPSEFSPSKTISDAERFATAVGDSTKGTSDGSTPDADGTEPVESEDASGGQGVEIPAGHETDGFDRPEESEDSMFQHDETPDEQDESSEDNTDDSDNEIDQEAGKAAVANMEADHVAQKESQSEDESASAGEEPADDDSDPDSTENETGEAGEESGESDEETEDGTDEQDAEPLEDGSKSASGTETIPSKLGRRVEDLEQQMGKMEEDLSGYQEKLKDEIELEENKISRVYRELEHYERIVDNREEKIDALQQILFIMCKIGNHPVFDEIANGLSDDDTPLEDIIDDSFIDRIKKREQEHRQAQHTAQSAEENSDQRPPTQEDEGLTGTDLVPANPQQSTNSEKEVDEEEGPSRSFFSSFF